MKTTKILAIIVVALGLIAFQAGVSEAAPVGTAFTYQGHLYDANQVANGLYDFQFKLYDANTNGNQEGGDVNVPDVDVIDAQFTVELDFGNVYDGNERWLEIGVRPGDQNDPCEYTILEPRQELTPTPYALYAGSDGDWMVSGNDMYSIPPGNVGIGVTIPQEKLDVDGDININSVYKIAGETVLSDLGTNNIFVGAGAGSSNTTGISNTFVGKYAGAKNETGIINTFVGKYAGLYNETGSANTFVGSSAGYHTTGGNNTFVGADAGVFKIEGSGNTFLGNNAGENNIEGSYNTFVGKDAGFNNAAGTGNVFIGHEAGYNETGSNKLYIANDRTDANTLIYGNFSTGKVGIGTTNPGTYKLYVNGGDLRVADGDNGNIHFGSANGRITYNQAEDDGFTFLTNHWESQMTFTTRDINGDYHSMLMDLDGKIGIGSISPTEVLDVNGTARLRGLGSEGGTWTIICDGTGKLFKLVSSKRYKTNIKDLETNPDAVLQLRPVRFQYKSSGQQDIGLIAEEVQEHLQELVIYDNQGRPDAVKYDRVALYLLDVVKTQQEKIAALEERLDALENTTQRLSRGKEYEL